MDTANQIKMLEAENIALRKQIKKLTREMRLNEMHLDYAANMMKSRLAVNNALAQVNDEHKTRLELLLEYCPNIIVLLDHDERLALSTQTLQDAVNVPNFEFIRNKHYKEMFGPYLSDQDMQAFDTAIQEAAATNGSVFFNSWINFSQTDGAERFYSTEIRQIDAIKGFILVMIDFTDYMEEKQRAESASNAKSDFLAKVSHELRTPMNAIVGLSKALHRMDLPDKHAKYVQDIQYASEALIAIIDDILDFSKIEANKMDIINGDYHLHRMLNNLYSMFSVVHNEKALEFTIDIHPTLPTYVHGDEKRLRQVLINLLGNAFKYTQRGRVTFSAWYEDGYLRFDVTDTGIGIRAADTDKLFLAFEQLDLRKNYNIVGTGLGLAICHNLCTIMGGEIWVNSIFGQGSTFSIKIPCEKAVGIALTDKISAAPFTAPTARVLVIDDIDINLAVAEVVLENFGIVPDLANSGEEAIALAQQNQYDLILMDQMMPKMDGLEATRLIRSTNAHNQNVPIIALTANVIKGTKELFLNNQMNDVLAKPIDLDAFNHALRRWLPPSRLIPH
ncbi:MAG: ATP-binding protein [Defluviitaleaceae bacterium]|nr:ATP-binding protein [Defluviitaleaceae bacterium]